MRLLLVPLLSIAFLSLDAATAAEPASPGKPRGGLFRRILTSASPAVVAKKPPAPKLYDQFLFFPVKHPDGNWAAADPKREDVWFKAADDTQLHGWYCPGEAPWAVGRTHGRRRHAQHCGRTATARALRAVDAVRVAAG